MSMFHRGHYNKIAALLGRRIAVEEMVSGSPGVVHDVAGAMVVMFEDDNENFDEKAFLRAVSEHAGEYRELLHSDS